MMLFRTVCPFIKMLLSRAYPSLLQVFAESWNGDESLEKERCRYIATETQHDRIDKKNVLGLPWVVTCVTLRSVAGCHSFSIPCHHCYHTHYLCLAFQVSFKFLFLSLTLVHIICPFPRMLLCKRLFISILCILNHSMYTSLAQERIVTLNDLPKCAIPCANEAAHAAGCQP